MNAGAIIIFPDLESSSTVALIDLVNPKVLTFPFENRPFIYGVRRTKDDLELLKNKPGSKDSIVAILASDLTSRDCLHGKALNHLYYHGENDILLGWERDSASFHYEKGDSVSGTFKLPSLTAKFFSMGSVITQEIAPNVLGSVSYTHLTLPTTPYV